jgi:hypothetical protein
MTNTSAFYLARADQCARDASDTRLDRVRERHLRSEAAWRAMAARLLHGERLRLATEQAKQEAS